MIARSLNISLRDFDPPTASRWLNENLPVVNVPVLSNTTVFTWPRHSRRLPPLIMIPRFAVAASPAEYVTGVLIVRAHGHAIMMKISPFNDQYLPTSSPKNHGTVQRQKAITSTKGVYFFANASTSFSVSDAFACASSINSISLDSAESPTVDEVRMTSCEEPTLMLPLETSSPGCFSTGRASPVRLLSSTDDVPSTTTPSAGTLSPVLTLTRHPTGRFDAGIITISPVAGSITFA
mmetsp:Transcript_30376/g.60960  ORF Transcript_30376/g.60960 Transcript_30376/m.60960 type:complete len:236 (+) Transcript_30376:1040-1747(+)